MIDQLLRSENGHYLCAECGTGYPTEIEARQCAEADWNQYIQVLNEAEQVQVMMGF